MALIPLLEPKSDGDGQVPEALAGFIAAVKATLGDAVSDVRPSERLTDSVACLVAPETAMDRQLERILARSGQIGSAAKPVLEINPQHELILRLSGLGEEDTLREDAAHLLLDQARILDGELPADLKAFSERLSRVIGRSAL